MNIIPPDPQEWEEINIKLLKKLTALGWIESSIYSSSISSADIALTDSGRIAKEMVLRFFESEPKYWELVAFQHFIKPDFIPDMG